ncbi:MAG: universal stress protein [Nocardiaceae bacterium]|nr:universal stress protein [Nocardiaceae bacterium]
MTLADKTSIVAGVDDSQTSISAALWGADLAHRMHVPLVLVHAVMLPSYYVANAADLPIEDMQGVNASNEAKEHLHAAEAAVRSAFPDIELSTWGQYGMADLALVGWSRRAQMIVVGAHRHTSASSLVFGSTTARVVNHSECPVVVWRGTVGSGPVLVGVDGSPLSALAVERAFELASWYGCRLHAVHAWGAGVEGASRDAAEALLAESLAGWQEKYPDVEVTQLAAALRPADAFLEYSHQARLIVVGSHGRGRASSLVLGSTSRFLVRHSPCPVMVCRSEIDGLA